MKVVAFFNHKGGVGKTTIVFNTAIALGELGHKVAIVDADAQANASAIALGEERYETAVNKNETLWTAVAPLVSGAGDFWSGSSDRTTRKRMHCSGRHSALEVRGYPAPELD